MGIKKKIVILIIGAIYLTFMTFGIIITARSNKFYHLIYNSFGEIAKISIFFFIYIFIILILIPGIYLNFIVEKKNFNIKESKKKEVKNRNKLGILLLIIGIPLVIWSIIGTYRYYKITDFYGGLGELALNGFLVFLNLFILLFIIPGLIFAIRRYENNFEEKDFKP